jgi:hypothetical protein
METLKIQTINTISSKINLLLTRVQNSTGSLHTKDDVRSLLTNLENELYDELGQVFDNAPVVENFTDQRFTLEEVMNVLENIDYSDYTKPDLDSAEFELSYRNQVELTSCDVEFDHEDFYNEIEKGLDEMLKEKQREAQPTEEETITIID